MPRRDLLSGRAEEYLARLPSVFRDSPEHLAMVHCLANEMDRLDERIEIVLRQFVPQTADVLLKVWEFMVRVTVEPSGLTVAERREIVFARLRRMLSSPQGRDWVSNVTALVGEGWSYEEHDPDDGGSPPDDTVRIRLPFPPGSSSYARAEALIEDITPAHLDLEVVFVGGFVLDASQLDQEGVQ